MSENPASKVQEKNPEKETSIPEETISNSVSAEFEENTIQELKEEDIPKNIPAADDSSSRINKSDLESAGFTLDEFASLLSKYDYNFKPGDIVNGTVFADTLVHIVSGNFINAEFVVSFNGFDCDCDFDTGEKLLVASLLDRQPTETSGPGIIQLIRSGLQFEE